MSMEPEQRLSAEGVHRARIDCGNGDVSVAWGPRSEIVVRGEEVNLQIHGSTVAIERQGGGKLFGLLSGGAVEIELPEEVSEGRIHTQRGDVRLTNPQGEVRARSDLGDVRIEGGRGDLTVRMGAGDVSISRYDGPVSIHTGAGDVKLGEIRGSIDVQSGTGDVIVRGGAGGIAMKTGAGDTEVSDRDCDEMSIMTGAGDVRLRGGSSGRTSIQTGVGDVNSEIALGDGHNVSHGFVTGSGDISIAVPRDIKARIEVTTARGSIDSEVPLIAVGKRGPRSPLGRRLVGSIGEGDDEVRAEISVRSIRGDVSITWLHGGTAQRSWAAQRPAISAPPPAPTPPPPPTAPRPPEAPAAPTRMETSMTEQTTETAQPIAMTPPAENPPESQRAGIGEERAILAALAAGSLSVEEAERLLDALSRRNGGAA